GGGVMPTMTKWCPAAASAATEAAALAGDVVRMVRMPARLKLPSLRTRKSPGTMPLEPGIRMATSAATTAPAEAGNTTMSASRKLEIRRMILASELGDGRSVTI